MKEPNFRDKQLGKNIRDIRLKEGLTLEEFAEQFDDPKPSASIISRWERGISVPNPKRLKRLSEISGIDVKDLYKRGTDFFEIQLRKLSDAYEENQPNIQYDLSQSYVYFNLGKKYLTFASERNPELFKEYEELLTLIGIAVDPRTHSYMNLTKEKSHRMVKEEIIRQLDKIHNLMSLPSYLANLKNEYDEMKVNEKKQMERIKNIDIDTYQEED